jgi:hypothetical protein
MTWLWIVYNDMIMRLCINDMQCYMWPIHLVTRLVRLICYTRTFKGPNVKRIYVMISLGKHGHLNYMRWKCSSYLTINESVKLNPCMLRYVRWCSGAMGGSLHPTGRRFEYFSGRSYQPPNVTNITIYSVDRFILSLTIMMDRRMANPSSRVWGFPNGSYDHLHTNSYPICNVSGLPHLMQCDVTKCNAMLTRIGTLRQISYPIDVMICLMYVLMYMFDVMIYIYKVRCICDVYVRM